MQYLRKIISFFHFPAYLPFPIFSYHSPLLIGLFCLLAVSCNRSSSPLGEVPPDRPVFSTADSLSMADTFEAALKNPEHIDSILIEAEALLAEKPELQPVYNTSYARFLILTGKLEDAREQVQFAIGEYGGDSLHYDLARYHNLMAAIEAYSKAHEESVYHFKQAIKIYEEHGDDRQASIIKFNLANVFFGRLDYESAYSYSQEALEPLEAAKDTANLTLCLSVLSIAETNLNKMEEAEEHARLALELAEQHPNFQGKLFSDYAMGEVELEQENYKGAIERLQETIALGESQQMLQWLLPVRAALLKAQVSAGNNKAAITVGETLVEQAAEFGNRDILYSALKNLAFAQENLGQYTLAFENMKEAEELFREQMSETTERVLRETLVKYETEKKNNIILQQENKLSRQQMWGVILVGSALLIILTLTWIGKNAQQKNKLLVKEKENAVYYAINEGEERERKRLAGELHDGIASNLVALKLKLENSHPFDFVAEDLLPLVTKTHEEIRHAAHNLTPLNLEQQSLASALRTFATECSHDRCDVLFQTNQEGETKNLPKHIALIIYRAVQELVQNALKHASASAISVQLMYQKDELWITVEDDGQGFDTAVIDHKQRNGLNNLIYRLEKIGGSVDMESQPNIGTTIFIHLKNLNT